MLVTAIMPFPHSLKRRARRLQPEGSNLLSLHSSIHVVVLHRCVLGGRDVATCSLWNTLEPWELRGCGQPGHVQTAHTGSVMSYGWGSGGETPNHAGRISAQLTTLVPRLYMGKGRYIPQAPSPHTCRVLFIVGAHFTLPQQQPVAQARRADSSRSERWPASTAGTTTQGCRRQSSFPVRRQSDKPLLWLLQGAMTSRRWCACATSALPQ